MTNLGKILRSFENRASECQQSYWIGVTDSRCVGSVGKVWMELV